MKYKLSSLCQMSNTLLVKEKQKKNGFPIDLAITYFQERDDSFAKRTKKKKKKNKNCGEFDAIDIYANHIQYKAVSEQHIFFFSSAFCLGLKKSNESIPQSKNENNVQPYIEHRKKPNFNVRVTFAVHLTAANFIGETIHTEAYNHFRCDQNVVSTRFNVRIYFVVFRFILAIRSQFNKQFLLRQTFM